MAVKDEIISYLKSADEQKRVREIAESIDYCAGYVRKKCKELKEENKIKGEKTTVIPACDTEDDWFVLTGDKELLLEKIEKYTNHAKDEMKHKSTEELLKYTKENVCERVTSTGKRYWEFWK